jgi:phosphoribosyl 1,2-cyclic phosphate phosphodiesterase
MPVYASAKTMADLERVFLFAFKGTNPFPGYLKPEPHLVSGPFRLGETTITPLPVPHGNAEVNGYMFTRHERKLIAYLSDCSAVPDEIAHEILGVECLIVDALREKPHPTHLSVAQALEVATRVQPKETYFIHIAHELSQSFEQNLPSHTHIAYDGLKLRFQ